jgi:predicted ATPase
MDGTSGGFIRTVRLDRERVPDFGRYPFAIPAVRQLESLVLDPHMSFFVGENGSGKSTLLEAIAIRAGFSPMGGSQNMFFTLRPEQSELQEYLRLSRGLRRPLTGYFLRAETFYNVATQVDENPLARSSHGGTSLHEQSHGESFLALVKHRFYREGLYILDEPESALSPQRQLSLLVAMHALVRQHSQFIIATHSPILLAYPGARIFSFGEKGVTPISYEETEHFSITRDFLLRRDVWLRRLLDGEFSEE